MSSSGTFGLLIFFILFFIFPVQAQDNIFLPLQTGINDRTTDLPDTAVSPYSMGFAIGYIHTITDKRSQPGAGISLAANYNACPDLNVECRVGYGAGPYYLGWDFSAGLYYKIIKPFFIAGSILNHFNDGTGLSTRTKNITLPGIGAGVDLSPVSSVELLYYFLLKPIYWHNDYDRNSNTSDKGNLESVIRLNFKFLWEL
jgi:hypothetical protein